MAIAPQTSLKPGTRIAVRGWSFDGAETWEGAKIGRIRSYMLPMMDGYHPVIFDCDGDTKVAKLLIHESGFRVTDNRA